MTQLQDHSGVYIRANAGIKQRPTTTTGFSPISNPSRLSHFIPISLRRTLELGASSGGLTPSAGDQLVQGSRRAGLASLFSWLLDAKAEMISLGFIPFLGIASDI